MAWCCKAAARSAQYEAGAIDYLYSLGMECAIAAGASAGAMNAATLAGATRYPPRVLRELWERLAVDGLIPFLPKVPTPFVPAWAQRIWGYYMPSPWVPGMYRPRLDYWNLPSWTSLTKPTLRRTLDDLLDWDQVRDARHMRLIVSASGVETGRIAYFSNISADELPGGPEYPAVRFGPEHVQASGSIFPGFPWTVITNRAWWDGGLIDNTPLKPVLDNLRGDEPATMPIFIIDVNSDTAPLPGNMVQGAFRLLEMFAANRLRADLDTARSYTRFITALRQADEQLPPDAAVRQTPEWIESLNYDHVRHIHLINMNKPAQDSPGDFSRASIERRLSAGYDQCRAVLEEAAGHRRPPRRWHRRWRSRPRSAPAPGCASVSRASPRAPEAVLEEQRSEKYRHARIAVVSIGVRAGQLGGTASWLSTRWRSAPISGQGQDLGTAHATTSS